MSDEREVTLTIPEDVLVAAQLAAERRGISLSALVTQALAGLVGQGGVPYEEAKRRQLELLKRGLDLGTHGRPPATREELHER